MGKKWILIIFLVPVVVALAGCLVQALWNCLVPELFNGPVLSFWQALGLLLLSKLLFSGFGGGKKWGCSCHCGSGGHWRDKMHSRMEGMTPEEKEQFKKALNKRCGWSDSSEK